jgi:IS605 OrfB family transposase
MQLVERHVIKSADPRFAVLDRAAFASKNRSNAANYVVRQACIHEGVYLNYREMDRRMQGHEAYQALPAKVAQWVLRILDKHWASFFEALAAWQADPAKFLGRPRLPGSKDKQRGRTLLVYPVQALSAPALREGQVVPAMVGVSVKTRQQNVQQVGVVPRIGFDVVEVIYEREPIQAAVDPALHAGVDMGIDTLAAIASDTPGVVPRVVNGRPVKSINQFYNKRRAELQSRLGHPGATRRLERLTTCRTRRIDHYLQTASRRIIDLLVAESIGTLVIGKNPRWKPDVTLGRRTNQNFVAIPHARFVDMLRYKAELVGIRVLVTEESSTSKASFLDADPLPVYGAADVPTVSGKRVKRG